ncbi:hypothetical protein RRF57_013292 [Xylaria bambusicola]|uniref:Uncharacterized protein n=1 Tax=Xylaria bambusicola TaxID=326684 RepID=A0AAN7ZBI8_9PEZI
MVQNSKNSTKGNLSPFELLYTEDDDAHDTMVYSTTTADTPNATSAWSRFEAHTAIRPRTTTSKKVDCHQD